ncbi:hypothetical protein [Ralstonia mannitolilytica]|uniref:hypothetical protein n=1 Tax=Ralstonia mannitolilytica TaxID=105219 RepID=UPI001C93DB5F|nr:hypothetical protein [Ralstonia mannitolilytica]MBY4717554.1 hypothetical protein [Ralstonia mannitolilytica]
MEDKRLEVLAKQEQDILRIAEQNITKARKKWIQELGYKYPQLNVEQIIERHPEVNDVNEIKKRLINPQAMQALKIIMQNSFHRLVAGSDPSKAIAPEIYEDFDYDAAALAKKRAAEQAALEEARKQTELEEMEELQRKAVRMPSQPMYNRRPEPSSQSATNKEIQNEFLRKKNFLDNLKDDLSGKKN